METEAALPVEFLTGQPYPAWAEGRGAGCPVAHHGSPYSGMEDREHYEILRFEDVEHVLRDWETFSSSINGEHIGKFMGEFMLEMNGPEHRAYRGVVAHAFRASALERWDKELVRPTIAALLDAIAPLGKAELVRDITTQYPVQVICGIAGVPLEDHEQFQQWAEEVNTGPLNPKRGHAASKAMRDYLAPLLEDRRANPREDLISEMVHGEVDGHRLTDEKIYGFLRLLLPAGAETTFRALGSALFALLTHPDELARVTTDRSLMPAVIEETLRWETSVTQVSRMAATDTEIAGCPIPAGASLAVITASANHDEERYDDPDEWRLDRPTRPHMAFGTGPHQCLGMHLARLELRVGLDLILDRLPNLRLDADEPMPVIQGQAFRGPTALPVLFDPN